MKSSGTGAIVRIVTAMAIVFLALLAVLFILDIVPRESFKEIAVKILSIGGIAIVSLIALSFVLRK